MTAICFYLVSAVMMIVANVLSGTMTMIEVVIVTERETEIGTETESGNENETGKETVRRIATVTEMILVKLLQQLRIRQLLLQ